MAATSSNAHMSIGFLLNESPGQALHGTEISTPRTEPLQGGSSGTVHVGLDEHGNPVLKASTSGRGRELAKLLPATNVDWRGGKARDCRTQIKLRAAHVQRAGTSAPIEQSCLSCRSGRGPFSTCRVLVHEGRLHFKGACANCAFYNAGAKCSFREYILSAILSGQCESELIRMQHYRYQIRNIFSLGTFFMEGINSNQFYPLWAASLGFLQDIT